ncbi:hypothetical protein [Burkholderia sp. MSMB1826]|uniref:hypothetical protein n=1 Tax=Burkholderia sp. MSMB1826 TaxID=1637875 RepID=UPI00211D74EC|nr:hypothetical protein [Burkholderia sp. MSMB1826]
MNGDTRRDADVDRHGDTGWRARRRRRRPDRSTARVPDRRLGRDAWAVSVYAAGATDAPVIRGPIVAFERHACAAIVTRIDALMSDLASNRSMRREAAANVGNGTLAIAGDPSLPADRELAWLDAKLTGLNRAFEAALFGKMPARNGRVFDPNA